MSLSERLILWLVGVAVALVPLLAGAVLSEKGWARTIDHGELILITISILTSAVAYAAMSPLANGFPKWVRAVVIGGGLVVVLFAALAYWSISEISPQGEAVRCLTESDSLSSHAASQCLREPTAQLSLGAIATLSYILMALGVVVAVLSIVSHRDALPTHESELS